MVKTHKRNKAKCKKLKNRISKARTKRSRGKALGRYAKAGCTPHGRRKKKK